jgi:Outer membrane protein beta-barrel domain
LKKRYTSVVAVVLLLMTAFTGTTYAQSQKVLNLPRYDFAKYHFGFILAGNQMLFSIKPNTDFSKQLYTNEQAPGLNYDSLYILSVTSDPSPGFTIGIVGNLRLGKYFDLRFIPSLAFGERNVNYSLLAYRDSVASIFEISKPITSTYVELPLHIRYKSKRLNNMRAYVLAGFKYNIDLASNKKNKAEDADGNPTFIKLIKQDLMAEFGVGFDFYTNFFKFGIELKMGYGLFDLLVRENNIFTDGISHLNSKILTFSLSFE